jgi:hypothetical protein
MKQAHKFTAVTMSIGLLSGCGLYMHDDSLQQSAESTRKLVSEADLSTQINGQLTGAADLANRQEAAIVNFYVMRRNQQLLALLQPDVLEKGAFHGDAATVSYVQNGSGFVRNPADLRADLGEAINCRLDALLVGPSCAIDPKTLQPAKATVRDWDALTNIRDTSFPEIQFTNADGLDLNVKNALTELQNQIAARKKAEPDLPDDPRGNMACADISAETKAAAPIAEPTTDLVENAFNSYATACSSAELGRAAAQPILQGASGSELAAIVDEIAKLHTQRELQLREGFRLATEMKALMKQIAAAQGPGPAQAGLAQALENAQKLLKEANGIAKLAGLRELADQTDSLLQIELNNSAAEAAGAPAATPPAAKDELTAKGEALVKLASAGAGVLDAYRDEAPSARAQALIVSRVALTQQIEVATLEAALLETKLRLLTAARTFMVNEAHQLAEAGLALQTPELGSNQTRNVLNSLAAAWDVGQIEERTITYRVFAAERETSIRISASNARNMQAAVLAASDQIVAYTKGGITKEMLTQLFAAILTSTPIAVAIGTH